MAKKEKMNYIVSAELLILAVLFSVMTMTIDVKPIGPKHTSVGLATFNGAVHKAISLNMTWYNITQILGYLACVIVGIFALIGLIQWIKRKNMFKVDSTILVAGGVYLTIFLLYVFFEKMAFNYRPVIMPGETKPEASFPSSHTMLAIVVFGSVAIYIGEYILNQTLATICKIALIVLMIVTIVGRLLSGVHWVTDIIASVLISAALIQIFYSVKYSVELRQGTN